MLPPSPTATLALLADLLCSPVAMRGDRFFALAAELWAAGSAGRGARETQWIRAAELAGSAPRSGAPLPWEEPLYTVDRATGVARLVVSGPLVKGHDAFTCWYWGLASTDRIQAAVLELAERADVTAVRLVLNSPGGMSIGMPETADLLVALGALKPLVGFTADLAASNGYRLLAACDVALATPSALVGSVGTYIALYDYTQLLADMGIKLELFRAGDLKAIGVPGKALTEAERAFLQQSVDRSNAAFTGFVRARRGEIADHVLQGQWFSGDDALAHGLVDGLVVTESQVAAAMPVLRP